MSRENPLWGAPVLRQNPSAVPWEGERNRVKTLAQPCSSSLISACSISAFNTAICRRISAFSRSKDSRDLNSDRIKCQLKEKKSAIECNIAGPSHRLRPPGVRSDGEVHRVVGFELFSLICSPELHGIPARLYSRIDAFEIRGNSENNFSVSGVDVAR